MMLPQPPVVVLMTDFGITDTFIGQMKGVILSITPTAQIIDLTHAVLPQHVVQGAFLLGKSLPFLPDGSVVVAVVDPGVGTSRRIIAVQTDRHIFLAPDNGLLTNVFTTQEVRHCIHVTEERYMLPQRSSTFHGRDIFSPVAAHVASGVPLQKLGQTIDANACMRLPLSGTSSPDNGTTWEGAILYTDHFGNLITSIEVEQLDLAQQWMVSVGSLLPLPLCKTYGDVAEHQTVAYIGSSGTIEIAIRNGNAAQTLGLKNGEKVALTVSRTRLIDEKSLVKFLKHAVQLHQSGQHKEAELCYQQILQQYPNHVDALHLRGVLAYHMNNYRYAVELYNKALALKPDFAEAYSNRGVALKELKQFDDALESYNNAIKYNPNYAAAYYNRANLYKELQQFDEALTSYNNAIALQPNYPEAYSNRGVVLKELKQFAEALASYNNAIVLKPNYAEAHSNKGSVLKELKQFDAAIKSFNTAIAIKPDYAEVYWNKSLVLLLSGNFSEGWQLYEWRWKKANFTSENRNFKQPLWLGEESIAGKTILLHSEQGLGDTIQFCRYAQLVSERGAEVILEVPYLLVPLLRELYGVKKIIAKGQKIPSFDYHIPLLSLPLAFKTSLITIPLALKYLSSDAVKVEEWKKRLGNKTNPRIGLVWSGRAEHKNDNTRSIALATLLPYLPDGFDYISLQKEVRESDKATLLAASHIQHFGDDLQDFTDTAALCELMDLIITVDTSVAHLAGALGKRTWLLLSFIPDWRWMLDRDDSPWYASVKLYRQKTRDDWDSVFIAIHDDIHLYFTGNTNIPPNEKNAEKNKIIKTLLQQAIKNHQSGNIAEAETCYQKILQLQPNHPDGLHLLGVAAFQQEKHDNALELLNKAITLKADFPHAYFNRGLVYKKVKEFEKALQDFDAAIALNQNYAAAYHSRGSILKELKKYHEALESYDKAIELNPRYSEAYCNRGNTLQLLKRFNEALESYNKALAIKPDYAEAYSNRGVVLRELKQLDEAVANFNKAIMLKPDYAEAYSNRGVVLRELKQLDEAIVDFNRATTLKPDYAAAYWNKSLLLLLMGNFTEGWQLHEWRWKKADFTSPKRDFTQPLWLGEESIEGKTILLHSEQGLGDTIQFCRYVKLVAERGARVIMEVPTTLAPLLKQLSAVSQIVTKQQPLPPFDYHCPFLSLPLACNTTIDTIPDATQYLSSDAIKIKQWQEQLQNIPHPRVGIVWSGNSAHKNDSNRSIELTTLLHYLPSSLHYVSLQKELRESDKAALAKATNMVHFGNQLQDFTDTAALCDLMDLVITVDTSVAHLAGALGKPTWILLPFIPDWRWMLDRDDSPWYASVKLYRQPYRDDWQSVLAQVQHDLAICYISTLQPTQRTKENQPKKAEKAIKAVLSEAIKLHQSGKLAEAAICYNNIIQLQPNHVDALHLLGVIAFQKENYHHALDLLNKALELQSHFAAAYFNRGLVYKALHNYNAALEDFNKAIELNPNYTEAYTKKGNILKELFQLEEALANYDTSIALNPDYAPAYLDKAIVLLLLGNLTDGWKYYEWRWKNRDLPIQQRNFSQPLWSGEESIDGKTILLHSEQGFGDTIQFCRYASLVAESGARVVLEVPTSLATLLQSLNGVSTIITKGEPLPEFDIHCPLLTLPLAFKTTIDTIPFTSQYLSSNSKKGKQWKKKLSSIKKKRIGIVWSGRIEHKNDHNRSIALAKLLYYLPDNFTYISLQKEVRESDKPTLLAASNLQHFGDDLQDFSDTAALCDLMDLVITVDTSVAHLAAALGKPTWILLPLIPDWRWLLDRDDSPWYASVKLYRQTNRDDWDSVLERVQADLVQRFLESGK